MLKAEEVKQGYWFYNSITEQPVQAKSDGDKNIAGLRVFEPLPITAALLLKFGFIVAQLPGMKVYEKKGFKLYKRKHSENYQLMQFGELRKELKYIHEVQKIYREEVE